MEARFLQFKDRHAELVSASISQQKATVSEEKWTLKQVQGDAPFVEKVVILSGQTALLLGWRPDDFWNATPAELGSILAALSPQSDAAVDQSTLAKLMVQFPDVHCGDH